MKEPTSFQAEYKALLHRDILILMNAINLESSTFEIVIDATAIYFLLEEINSENNGELYLESAFDVLTEVMVEKTYTGKQLFVLGITIATEPQLFCRMLRYLQITPAATVNVTSSLPVFIANMSLALFFLPRRRVEGFENCLYRLLKELQEQFPAEKIERQIGICEEWRYGKLEDRVLLKQKLTSLSNFPSGICLPDEIASLRYFNERPDEIVDAAIEQSLKGNPQGGSVLISVCNYYKDKVDVDRLSETIVTNTFDFLVKKSLESQQYQDRTHVIFSLPNVNQEVTEKFVLIISGFIQTITKLKDNDHDWHRNCLSQLLRTLLLERMNTLITREKVISSICRYWKLMEDNVNPQWSELFVYELRSAFLCAKHDDKYFNTLITDYNSFESTESAKVKILNLLI